MADKRSEIIWQAYNDCEKARQKYEAIVRQYIPLLPRIAGQPIKIPPKNLESTGALQDTYDEMIKAEKKFHQTVKQYMP